MPNIQQAATSISIQQSNNCKPGQFYTVRKGTIDSGKDYEIRMTALMALRSVRPEIEKASLAFNAEGCSDFDDLVIYHKTNKNSRLSLVQLKHQDIARSITSHDFFKDDGNFSLVKYTKGYGKLSLQSLQVFDDDEVNEMELILYTNRSVESSIDFLKKKDNHFLNTNGNIYTFNENHSHLQEYPQEFLEKLLLFVDQTDCKSVNQLIINEIEQLIPNGSQFINVNFIDNFVTFISSWAKGQLGGHYMLTKDRIISELISLLLDCYCLKFYNLNGDIPAANIQNSVFDEIISNHDIILISLFNDEVITFLRGFFNKWLILTNPAVLDADYFRKLFKRFSSLTYHIPKYKVTDGTVTVPDLYKALWQMKEIPLPLLVDTDEYLNLHTVLNQFKTDNKFIIMSKNTILPKTSSQNRILVDLNDLNKKLENLILNHDIMFQGRSYFKLQQISNISDLKKLIFTKDIINILNGTFNIGNTLTSPPQFYISRTLPKILLKIEAFNLTEDIFVVAADDRSKFENHLKKTFTANYLLVEHFNPEHLNNSTECLIICNDFVTTKKIHNRNTHYLKFQSHIQELEWLKSCGKIVNLRPYLKGVSKANYCLDASSPDSILNKLSNLNIITAESGMGKSVALNTIALQTSLDFWVLKIELNKFIDYFYNLDVTENKGETYLNYFGAKLLESCSTILNEMVFEEFLNKKSVLILFDEFDEISPLYADKVAHMIHAINDANYQIWIATRSATQFYLEQEFNLFSHILIPFTEHEQVNFFCNYFNANLLHLEGNQVNKIGGFVQGLLNFIKINLRYDALDLIGIPLMARMLAEMCLDGCESYVKSSQLNAVYYDILFIYEEFVKMKENEFIAKYKGNHAYRVLKLSREYHMLYAAKTLFDFFPNSRLIDEKISLFIRSITDGSNTIGLVTLKNNTLSFLNKTLTEYYAALWLVENYENCTFIETLADPNFKIVRNFFDRIMVRKLPLHTAIMNRSVNTIKNILVDKNAKIL